MRSKQLSRADLIDVLGHLERRVPIDLLRSYQAPLPQPDRGRIWACWRRDEDFSYSQPQLIIVRDDELEDFFAWTSTFLPDYRPFSAFCRTMPYTYYSLCKSLSPSLGEIGIPCVGAVLGEAFTEIANKSALATLPLSAFCTTYSYCLARTKALSFDDNMFRHVSASWRVARDITEQAERKLTLKSLDEVWGVLLSLDDSSLENRFFSKPSRKFDILSLGCREIRSTGSLPYPLWWDLSEGRLDLDAFQHEMRSSRERRVEAFEKAVNVLTSGGGPEDQGFSFLLGYLASQISDGTLDHVELLEPLIERFPTVMLWYGITAGLRTDNRVLNTAEGLGRRILNELLKEEHLMSTPNSDTSLEEFEILLRSERRDVNIRQRTAGSLLIEVAPRVTTLVKWPARRRPNEDQLSLIYEEKEPESIKMQELLAQIESTTRRIRSLIREGSRDQAELPKQDSSAFKRSNKNSRKSK